MIKFIYLSCSDKTRKCFVQVPSRQTSFCWIPRCICGMVSGYKHPSRPTRFVDLFRIYMQCTYVHTLYQSTFVFIVKWLYCTWLYDYYGGSQTQDTSVQNITVQVWCVAGAVHTWIVKLILDPVHRKSHVQKVFPLIWYTLNNNQCKTCITYFADLMYDELHNSSVIYWITFC